MYSDQDLQCSTTQPRGTKKILRNNQNGFRRNRSTTIHILTIRRILEGVRAKKLEAAILFIDFFNSFESKHRGKMEQILLACGLLKDNIAAIMMLYKNTKEKSAPRIETQTISTSSQVCCKETY